MNATGNDFNGFYVNASCFKDMKASGGIQTKEGSNSPSSSGDYGVLVMESSNLEAIQGMDSATAGRARAGHDEGRIGGS